MSMKKILALLLALAMVFALAACGDDKEKDDDKKENTSESAAPSGSEPAETNTSIVGTWTSTVTYDNAEIMEEEAFEGTTDIVYLVTFEEDGDFVITLDGDAMKDDIDALEEQMVEQLIAIMIESAEVEDEAAMDEALLEEMGKTTREVAEEQVAAMDLLENLKDTIGQSSGEYEIVDGALTINGDAFGHKISGNKLTLTGDNDLMENVELESWELTRA